MPHGPMKAGPLLRPAVLAALWLGGTVATAAQPPVLTDGPTVSPTLLVADDATVYTAQVTFSDADGHSSIRCIRVLFNFTEDPVDRTWARGYLAWGRTDADIGQYGGTWVCADATGGGRWGYRTDAWGGTTYMTPLSCQTTTAGPPSGGTGSRTVQWSFTVKPAWAFNPVMNDLDAWAADGVIGGASYAVGWFDGTTPFDVVAAPCSTVCQTPRPPLVFAPTAHSLNVAIDPADSSVDLFTIRIDPPVAGKAWVQADGSPGLAPRWATRTQWGSRQVAGLLPGTIYTFSARASRSQAGFCPSPWSPGGSGTTTSVNAIVDPFAAGRPFSRGVRGQCPYRQITTAGYETLWDLTIGSMARGLAGGLDADTYDWRDIRSGADWGQGGGAFTTLQFLQYARDHAAVPMISANAFGGGARDATGTFVCAFDNPDGLAADWVRYTNVILQNYRQGDEGTLTGENLRVWQSITGWAGRPRLPEPQEPPLPRVQYWEIGNEPELGGIPGFLSNHYLSPSDYATRYKLIAAAMLAVDPDLKLGPCLMTTADPAGSGQWLDALAADPDAPLDFVSYHPYYGNIKNQWNYPEGMTSALRAYQGFLQDKAAGTRAILNARGRSDCRLVASEYNPVNWDAPGYMQASMAAALGVVESCFTFALDDLLAATFWEQPQSMLGLRDAFAGMVAHMGDVLVTTGAEMEYDPSVADFRVYVTRDSAIPGRLMIWGLNFHEEIPATVRLGLKPSRVISALLRRYGRPGSDPAGGDTSLTHWTGMAWTQEDVTAGFDTTGFDFVMDDAEITVLVLDLAPAPSVDHDRDGDVDQGDFGWFQRCLSGRNVPQPEPACADALLDGDNDVDDGDTVRFLRCMTAPGVPANPACAS